MTTKNNNGYKKLIAWQKSMDLVIEIYKLVEFLPKEERFNLGSQISRSAISIPSNIAEGYRRFSKKSFKNFLIISFGSGAELETQIEIIKRLKIVEKYNFNKIDSLLDEVMKILNVLISKNL
jgi:four helix bundle protein